MKIKNLIDEDFINYRKPSMFIAAPSCTFKCDKECGECICQNSALAAAPDIEIEPMEIVERFNSNPITKAIVFGGLEPLDNGFFLKFCPYIPFLNKGTDIVVYTGYYPEEIHYSDFQHYYGMSYETVGKLIFKFGRFIPNQKPHYDDVIGVELASDNQFAYDYMTKNGAENARDYHKKVIEMSKEIRRNMNENESK